MFIRQHQVARARTHRILGLGPDPGQPFAKVEARPLAQLDRMRHVLLVFTEKSVGG